MPLTPKGKKILRAMRLEYGPARGKAVFYASLNKGRIEGAETAPGPRHIRETPSRRGFPG